VQEQVLETTNPTAGCLRSQRTENSGGPKLSTPYHHILRNCATSSPTV